MQMVVSSINSWNTDKVCHLFAVGVWKTWLPGWSFFQTYKSSLGINFFSKTRISNISTLIVSRDKKDIIITFPILFFTWKRGNMH